MIFDEYAAAIETALSPAKGCCRRCGEARAAAMLNRDQLCYRCDRRRRGLSEIEAHHLFGPNTSLTVDLPVNEHRIFDAMRLSRPRFLQQPGSELLVNAAQLALLFGEIAVMIADHVRRDSGPQWIAPLADVLAGKALEATEALLLFGGHFAECAGAEWHKSAPRWTP